MDMLSSLGSRGLMLERAKGQWPLSPWQVWQSAITGEVIVLCLWLAQTLELRSCYVRSDASKNEKCMACLPTPRAVQCYARSETIGFPQISSAHISLIASSSFLCPWQNSFLDLDAHQEKYTQAGKSLEEVRTCFTYRPQNWGKAVVSSAQRRNEVLGNTGLRTE